MFPSTDPVINLERPKMIQLHLKPLNHTLLITELLPAGMTTESTRQTKNVMIEALLPKLPMVDFNAPWLLTIYLPIYLSVCFSLFSSTYYIYLYYLLPSGCFCSILVADVVIYGSLTPRCLFTMPSNSAEPENPHPKKKNCQIVFQSPATATTLSTLCCSDRTPLFPHHLLHQNFPRLHLPIEALQTHCQTRRICFLPLLSNLREAKGNDFPPKLCFSSKRQVTINAPQTYMLTYTIYRLYWLALFFLYYYY